MNHRGIALLVLIAVFLFGLLLGAGGVFTWGWRPSLERDAEDSRLPGRDGRPDRLVETLQLTPEQQVKLKAIYDDLRRERHAVRADMGARFDSVRTGANEKISAIL